MKNEKSTLTFDDTPPEIFGKTIIVQVNGKTYINYRECVNGKWVFTLMSILNCLLG